MNLQNKFSYTKHNVDDKENNQHYAISFNDKQDQFFNVNKDILTNNSSLNEERENSQKYEEKL